MCCICTFEETGNTKPNTGTASTETYETRDYLECVQGRETLPIKVRCKEHYYYHAWPSTAEEGLPPWQRVAQASLETTVEMKSASLTLLERHL